MVPTYRSSQLILAVVCTVGSHCAFTILYTHCMFAVVCTSATNCTYKVHNRHKLAVMGTLSISRLSR